MSQIEQTIKNAIITSASITIEREMLSAGLSLDYGGMGQGFGGRVLYRPLETNPITGIVGPNYCGVWLYECMKVAGVESWDRMNGQTIRVRVDKPGLNCKVVAIGHIVRDHWFNVDEYFDKILEIQERAAP